MASDTDSTAHVQSLLRSGKVWGLAVSGKLASGKDTIAALAMQRLDAQPLQHQSWATPLKEEMDAILADISAAAIPDVAVSAVKARGIPMHQAQELVSELWAEARNGSHARSRTPKIRWGLQFLGTDIRRTQHPDYWVERAVDAAVATLAEGTSVFLTDCRFPNEVEAARRLGLYTVRLEVAPEIQAARLRNRDGLSLDPKATTHPSETALDGYTGFDLVVDNNGPIVEAVEIVVAAMRARAYRF